MIPFGALGERAPNPLHRRSARPRRQRQPESGSGAARLRVDQHHRGHRHRLGRAPTRDFDSRNLRSWGRAAKRL